MKALSLMGHQGIQDSILTVSAKAGIEFPVGDCSNEVVLENALEQHGDIDVVLINTSVVQLSNMDSFFTRVRELSQYVRIILILDGSRPQYVNEQFEDVRLKYNIFDILFEKSHINVDLIVRSILKGKLTDDEIAANEGIEREEPHEPAAPSEIPPEPLQDEIESDSAPKKRDQQIPLRHFNRTIIIPARKTGCITVGVFGSSHCAGVTRMTISLADYFASAGMKTAAVGFDSTLSFAETGAADYYVDSKVGDLEYLKPDYDFVVVDFGVPFYLTATGEYLGIAQGSDIGAGMGMRRCDLKICMGFSDAYQINKTRYLLDSDEWKKIIDGSYIFLFDNDPGELKTEYPNVNMFDRNAPEFGNAIAELFFGGGYQ